MRTEQEVLDKIAEIESAQRVHLENANKLISIGWFGSALMALENYERREIEKNTLTWILEG